VLIFDCFSCSVFEIESVNPKNKQKLKGPLPSVANTGALTRKEDMTNIEEELKKAQENLDNNPVLEYSPGDLRRMGKTVRITQECCPDDPRITIKYSSCDNTRAVCGSGGARIEVGDFLS